MPKLRMAAEEIRERAYHRAMARAQVDMGIYRDCEVADMLKMSKSTFCRAKQDGYRSYGFAKAGTLARGMGMTGREVCAILGVPYEDPKDD